MKLRREPKAKIAERPSEFKHFQFQDIWKVFFQLFYFSKSKKMEEFALAKLFNHRAIDSLLWPTFLPRRNSLH